MAAELASSRCSVRAVFGLHKITKDVVLLTFGTLRSHLEYHSSIILFSENIVVAGALLTVGFLWYAGLIGGKVFSFLKISYIFFEFPLLRMRVKMMTARRLSREPQRRRYAPNAQPSSRMGASRSRWSLSPETPTIASRF